MQYKIDQGEIDHLIICARSTKHARCQEGSRPARKNMRTIKRARETAVERAGETSRKSGRAGEPSSKRMNERVGRAWDQQEGKRTQYTGTSYTSRKWNIKKGLQETFEAHNPQAALRHQAPSTATTHAHTSMNAYIHTRIHTYIHTRIHAYIHQAQAHTRPHAPTRTRA